MNNNASQSIVRLTVAYQKLEDAIAECDRIRRPPTEPTTASRLGETMCMDCESFDLDYLIKQIDSMAALASNRARQVRWISGQIQSVGQDLLEKK